MESGASRTMTARLPNLLVAGVPKCGTTSLFDDLTQHPEVCGARHKEPGYFDQFSALRPAGKRAMSLDEYASEFASCGPAQYAVEATPSYCYGGRPVIEAIERTLNRPRIILVLRNPTERLWSAYTFQRATGNLRDIPSFDAYVDRCVERRERGLDQSSTEHLHGLAIGFYGSYVPLWLEAFGERLQVVFSEDLGRDTPGVVGSLFDWLRLPPYAPSGGGFERSNVTIHPRHARLADAVFGVKRAVDRAHLLPAPVRRRLRAAYVRLNAASAPAKLSDVQRERVDGLYRASNGELGRALSEAGYPSLPPWLTTSPSQAR
jgi:Sulfotransferase domain